MFDKLIEILAAWIEAFQFWIVIEPYERGVQIRLGVFKQILEPGLHWLIPFHIDHVIYEEVVPRTERISGLSTTTSDGKAVGFDAVITYRINDVKKALLEVMDMRDAIADSCAGVIGTKLTESTWDQIKGGDTLEGLTTECRKRGWKWGVEVQQVQLTGIAIVKNLRVALSMARSGPVTEIHVQ